MLSVNEYAKEKGIIRQAVMKQVAGGQLISKKKGGKWYIVQPEVQPTVTTMEEDENLYTGVWMAINRLTKQIEILEQRVAKLERAQRISGIISGRGARDILSNKKSNKIKTQTKRESVTFAKKPEIKALPSVNYGGGRKILKKGGGCGPRE